MSSTTDNPYLNPAMPLSRVESDALAGVVLAKEAWRKRAPELAAKALGRVVLPGHEREQANRARRILTTVGDYQRRRKWQDAPIVSAKQE